MPETKTIRWGVLSTAAIGRKQVIPAIQGSRNGEVVAIASRELHKARSTAEEFGILVAYGSYEELLADASIDAIYNPLPVSLHAEWAVRAAHAGKPMLCEKPLAANAAQARRMVEAYRQANLPLAEAFMYRHHPLTRKVKQLVEEGVIGEVHHVRAVFHVVIDDPEDIRLRPETGGGAMRDVGCYCVGVIRTMLGEEPTEIKAVGNWNDAGVDVRIAGAMRFASGAMGHFACGFQTPLGCNYELAGTKGRLFVEDGMIPPGDRECVIRHFHGPWNEHCDEIRVPVANSYRNMVEDFADALLLARPPRFPMTESVANSEAIDRVLADAAPKA